jgi:hypothetical protein
MVLCLTLLTASLLAASADEKKPPSITYPANRSSKAWIETPTGAYAVDEGIEWQGIKVYLGLTWQLIAVDAKTDKPLWSHNVSAFWNAMAIKEVGVEKDKKTWAVELRPTTRDDEAKKLTALYDLKTGKEIKLPGTVPSGAALKLRKVCSGDQTSLDKGFTLLVTKPENWTKVRERLFAGLDKAEAPLAKDIDFTKEIVLVVSAGDSFNCRGYDCEEAYEDDQRILVRLHASTFQSRGEGVRCRPYGILILPRAEKKAYVVERNRQRYIGGPPLWTESYRAEKLPDPLRELDALPAGR